VRRQGRLFDFGQPEGTPGQREALAILTPHFPDLIDSVETGWRDFNSEVTESGRARMEARTRANIVSDFTRDRAIALFSGRSGVRPCLALGFFKLYVDDRVVLRIKKLDGDLLPTNVQTDQQRDWYNNEPVVGVPSECLRLNLGYRLDAAADRIADIVITWQPSWRVLGWYYSILDEPGEQIRPIDSPTGPQPMPLPQVEIIPRIAKTGEQAK
jgi:hypothetical protein